MRSVSTLLAVAFFAAMPLQTWAFTASETYSTAGTYTFTVPDGVTELTVETWGAGGSGDGQDGTESDYGAGGGGGAFARDTITVSPGDEYTFVVGEGACPTCTAPGGDSWFGSTSTVMAKGGFSASDNHDVDGGSAIDSVGAVTYNGGDGEDQAGSDGGAGGSSAGPDSDGGNATSGPDELGGEAPPGGGDGGDAGYDSNAPEDGFSPGGGGGGGGGAYPSSAGAGADGQVRILYPCPEEEAVTYSTAGSSTFTVPAGVTEIKVEAWGAGGSGAAMVAVWGDKNDSGGAGGGGAYASSRIPVSSGDTYTVQVGKGACGGNSGNGCDTPGAPGGDSWFGSTSTVMAKGGNSDHGDDGGVSGGSAASSVGSITYSGGTGDDDYGSNGGGGGSSAGPGGNGVMGDNQYGAPAPTGGGDGGNGGMDDENIDPEDGFSPGGGGGGAHEDKPNLSGAGADGQVRISYCKPPVRVDHYEISHSGVGLTCTSEAVTVRACLDSDCSSYYPDPVDVTLSPTGWEGGDTFTLTETASRSLSKTSVGTVTLDAASSSPAPLNDTLCQIGGGALSSGNCDMTFHDSVLQYDVPDVTADKVSADFTISAVSTDPDTSACVPAFADVTRTVDFWTNHLLPSGGDLSVSPGIVVNDVTVGTSSGSATGVSLSFDGSGQATASVRYPEAGSVELEALYTGSSGTGDDGLSMPGADSFTSIPAGFCVSADSADSACTGTLSECSVLAAAGDLFDLTVSAVAWEVDGETDTDFCSGNATTRNFRHDELSLSHSLVAPEDEAPGTLSVNSVAFDNADEGSKTVDQAVSEVGVFRFSVPTGETYLSRSLNGATSANIGRFTPADFLVTVPDPGELSETCAAGADFAYTGQALSWFLRPDIKITARNADGGTTENYTITGFRKLGEDDLSRTWPTEDDNEVLTDSSGNLPVSHEAGSESLAVISPGVMVYRFSMADELTYTKQVTARKSPFTPSVTFTLDSFTDSDSVSADAPLPDVTPVASFEMRYGRLMLTNVARPESSGTVVMPFQTEYWSGDRYRLNADDSCTHWDTTNITYSATYSTLTAASGTVSGGLGDGLDLEPLGTQGTDIATWSVPAWLQDDRDGDGALENPRGLATFGVYRGSDHIIRWGEH